MGKPRRVFFVVDDNLEPFKSYEEALASAKNDVGPDEGWSCSKLYVCEAVTKVEYTKADPKITEMENGNEPGRA